MTRMARVMVAELLRDGTTLKGGVFSMAELVYAGSGQWLVVNQQGSLTSQ